MFKKSILIMLSLILLISVFPFDVGGSIADLQQKQEQLENQIKEYRKQAEELKGEKDNVQAEINALDYEINALNLEVDNYELQKQELNMKISETEQEIEKLTQEIEENNEILEERLRVMYKNGTAGYLEVILNADSLMDALTRADMIKLIVQSDVELLKSIETQKTEVEEKNLSLKTKRLELTAVINELEEKQEQVLLASRSKLRYMVSIENDIAAIQKIEAEMEAQSAQIEKDILAAQRAVEYAGGEMLWPAPGNYKITSEYGERYHPITGVYSFHGGTDIGAPYGSKIVSANDGVVIYTGYHWSYGNYVIVDHGGGISTLYAHCSKLLVSNGQPVSRGDDIALVGSTGESTGPHLHFEVRINGVRTQPMDYLK